MRPRAAVWTGSDFDVCTPAWPSLGTGEVLVEIELATVCGSDRHTVAGRRRTPVPTILGHEGVGRVVGIGPDAPVTIGDRVVWGIVAACGSCARCVSDTPQKCTTGRKYGHERLRPGWSLSGTFATHVHLLAGTEIVVVPDVLDATLLAPAGCATATVTAAMRRGGLSAADRVLVTGCGMLGLTAVAYALDRGVRSVFATDPDPGRRQAAAELGATTCRPDDLPHVVGSDGVDLALEVSGAPAAVEDAVALAATTGRVVLAGSVAPGPPIAVDPEQIVRRMLTIVGSHNYGPTDLREAAAFLTRTRHADALSGLTVVGATLEQISAVFSRTPSTPRVAITPT